MKINIINDGENITNDFIDKWNIYDLCNYYPNRKTINFVGIIIKRNDVLMSFPKKCHLNNETENEQIELIKKILHLFSKEKLNNIGVNQYDYNNFPIRAYYYILSYFKKYGLYKQKEIKYNKDFIGNIDWYKTINASLKILQTNGIIFYPFIVKSSENVNVFISYCMDLVLYDAVQYSTFIEEIYRYKNKYNHLLNISFEMIINELKKIRNNYFKDIEKKLINNLIQYFEWKSSNLGIFRFVTTTFEYYWEQIVMSFLNHNNINIINDKMIISKKIASDGIYVIDSDDIESKLTIAQNNTRKFKIKYDHIKIDSITKEIYLFDSKYYDKIEVLNYKQMVYHYNLQSKYKNYKIINGLILPTSDKYSSRIHVDRSDIDNVKIVEHYLNIKELINNYTS